MARWFSNVVAALRSCLAPNAPAAGVAVFIDGDSISAHHAQIVLRHLRRHHHVRMVRIYGNINNRNVTSWSNMGKRQGAIMRHLPNLVQGKNSADIALVIDALELHLTRQFASYAVLSSDTDFTPLILRLKEDGAEVLGYGHRSAPVNLRRVFTAFHLISDLGDADAQVSG